MDLRAWIGGVLDALAGYNYIVGWEMGEKAGERHIRMIRDNQDRCIRGGPHSTTEGPTMKMLFVGGPIHGKMVDIEDPLPPRYQAMVERDEEQWMGEESSKPSKDMTMEKAIYGLQAIRLGNGGLMRVYVFECKEPV